MIRKFAVVLIFSCSVFFISSSFALAAYQPFIGGLILDQLPDKVERTVGIVKEVKNNFFVMENGKGNKIFRDVTNIDKFRIPLLCSKVFKLRIIFRLFFFLKPDGSSECRIIGYGWPSEDDN